MARQNPVADNQSRRFVRTVLPGIAIAIFGILVLFGILVYKISYPGVSVEGVNPSQYILSHQDLEIASDDDREAIPAWWIPGQKGAPGIILATGYGMSRTDALSLAAALNQMSFNLLIFDQRGGGAAPRGISTFGLKETTDMIAAIQFLKEHPDSDPNRIGIWGVDVSAFAALKAAADFPEVRVLAADSPFPTIQEFMDYRLAEDFGIENGIMQFACNKIFQLFYIFSKASKDYSLSGTDLAAKSILFIKGENRPRMAKLTDTVYEQIEPRKEMDATIPGRIHAMSGEMLKEYDQRVAAFFQSNLSAGNPNQQNAK
ncbi:MAG: hypothetical protein LBP68_05660 [Acidobacteriota bacterium]|jgi:pimeloyl-ACP methyl ester carboxylesterase|nr:hypothetical protein [Acidobacteriota bacterium]